MSAGVWADKKELKQYASMKWRSRIEIMIWANIELKENGEWRMKKAIHSHCVSDSDSNLNINKNESQKQNDNKSIAPKLT